MNPRPAMILKTAPNMDNAKVFVDICSATRHSSWWQCPNCCPAVPDIRCDKRSNLEDIPQDHARLGQDDGKLAMMLQRSTRSAVPAATVTLHETDLES